MTHKLLLADDSVTIQRVVELTFSGEDVQVVAVGDGEQAIARIPTERPDIVLADIGMPKRNGYDVAAFVKGQPELAHIPVLLLAGAFEPVDEARAQQVKCDGVLVKPFEPQQVIARVRELVDASKNPSAPATYTPAPVAERAPIEPTPVAAAPAQAPPEPAASPIPESRPEPAPPVHVSHPTVDHAPRIEAAEPHVPSQLSATPKIESVDPGLDDYFDRLDAAFARLGSASDLPDGPQASRALEDLTAGLDIPTINDLLGPTPAETPLGTPSTTSHVASAPIEPPDREATLSPSPRPSGAEASPARFDQAPAGRNIIADAFTALLASEQGDADAAPIVLTTPQPPVITDELVDAVTRRVLERLAPDAAHELVAQIVSDTAERLIRDEIGKIKAAVGRP